MTITNTCTQTEENIQAENEKCCVLKPFTIIFQSVGLKSHDLVAIMIVEITDFANS